MRLLTAIFIFLFIASCSSRSVQPIAYKATVITGQQLDSLRPLFGKVPVACHLSVHIRKTADTSSYDLTSSVDTNNNIIQITLPGEKKSIITEMALSNSVGQYTYAGRLGDTILCDQTPKFWFLAWFNEPFYRNTIEGDLNKYHRYELHVRAIEKSSGKKCADEILYTTDCCIDRLDMKYNPYSQSILYAFNDFGRRDYKVLYGEITFKEDKIKFQKPIVLNFKDVTEKRQPTFVDNGKSIYLYYTTGDNWGLLSGHVGNQQIGISQVDNENRLVNPKIVKDTLEIDEKIVFVADTVFYRLRDSNEYDKMTIKKVAWKDIQVN
jgi:hypothetical protein